MTGTVIMWVNDKVSKRCKRYNIPGHAHELTFSCYRNRSFLSSTRICDWLVESIKRARNKHDFSLWSYVFMPDHVHMIICPHQESYSISSILQAIKQPVSFKSIRYLKKEKPKGLSQLATGQKVSPYRFWQKGGGYDRNISSVDVLLSAVKYVHNNPVRKALAQIPEDWYYSSAACWAAIRNDPMAVDKDDWPVI
jgi:putative transposase